MCSKSQKVTKVCKEHPSLANLGLIPTSLSLFNLTTCVHRMCQQMGVCWVKLTEIRFVEQDCCLLGAPFPQSDAKETRLPPHNPCCSFCSSFTSPAFSFHEISNHCHSQGLGKMNPSLSNQIIDWMQGGGASTNWITRKGGGWGDQHSFQPSLPYTDFLLPHPGARDTVSDTCWQSWEDRDSENWDQPFLI